MLLAAMVALWIFTGLVALVMALLVAPIRVRINTTTSLYEVSWGYILKLQVMPTALLIRVSFFKLHRDWPVVPRARQHKTRKAKRRKRRAMWISPRKIRRILRSFRIREWSMNLDTGDYCRNAYLFPLFVALTRWRGDWRVNFDGEFELRLTIHNRLSRILVAFLTPSATQFRNRFHYSIKSVS